MKNRFTRKQGFGNHAPSSSFQQKTAARLAILFRHNSGHDGLFQQSRGWLVDNDTLHDYHQLSMALLLAPHCTYRFVEALLTSFLLERRRQPGCPFTNLAQLRARQDPTPAMHASNDRSRVDRHVAASGTCCVLSEETACQVWACCISMA